MAEVQIQGGIIRIVELDVQDQKAAAALAEYPQARWAEITRRALKIGLGYMNGGGMDSRPGWSEGGDSLWRTAASARSLCPPNSR